MVAWPEGAVVAAGAAAGTVGAAVALAVVARQVVAAKAQSARESVVRVEAMATEAGVEAQVGAGLPRRCPASGTWSGRQGQGVRTYRSRTHSKHPLREQRRSIEAPQRPPAACSHLAWPSPL